MRATLWTRGSPPQTAAPSYATVLRTAAMLAETDPDRFSLEAVADRLGVRPDAVRARAPDAESLVVRLHAQWHQRLIVEMDPIYEDELPGERRLAAMLEARRELARRTPGQRRLFGRYAAELEEHERVHSRRLARLLHTNVVMADHSPSVEGLLDEPFDDERVAAG